MTTSFPCPHCSRNQFKTQRGLTLHIDRWCETILRRRHNTAPALLVRNHPPTLQHRTRNPIPDQITVEEHADIFSSTLTNTQGVPRPSIRNSASEESPHVDTDDGLLLDVNDDDDDDDNSFQTDQHILPCLPQILYGAYSTVQCDDEADPYTTYIDQHQDDDDLSSIDSARLSHGHDPPTISKELDTGSDPTPLADFLPWRPDSGGRTVWFTSDPIPPDLHNQNIEIPSPVLNPHLYRAALTPMETLLLKIDLICEQANCSSSVPDKIIKAIQESILEDGVDFKTEHIPSFETFIDRMQQRFPSPKSELVSVTLESPRLLESAFELLCEKEISQTSNTNAQHPADSNINAPPSKRAKTVNGNRNTPKSNNKTYNVDQDISFNRTQVVKYSFLEQVEDLLTDHTIFSDPANFTGVVSDLDNPFEEWGPKDGSLDEIVSGTWYKDTYAQAKAIQDIEYPNEPFLVIPVVLYMDKTGLDKSNRIAMEPVLLMLGILNRAARNKDNAKRLLGYLPDLDLKSSAEKQVQRGTPEGLGRSSRNYHRVLDIITEDISTSQGYTKRIVGYVRIGNKVQLRRLFLPIALVIGDGKSSDMLVGRYSTSQCHLRSRYCHCPTDQLSDPYHQCIPIDHKEVERRAARALSLASQIGQLSQAQRDELMEEYEYLKSVSRYMVLNAHRNLHFGANTNGILGAVACDPMHMFLHGVLKYVMKMLFGGMIPTEMANVDKTVHHTFARYRASGKTSFPRCNYVRGITNLTCITANEWAGVAFTVLLTMHNREGWSILSKSFDRQRKKMKAEYEKLVSKMELKKAKELELLSLANDTSADATLKKKELKTSICRMESSLKKFRDAAIAERQRERSELFDDTFFDEDGDQPGTAEHCEFASPHVCTVKEVMHLLEALLGFYSWYRSAPHHQWYNSSETTDSNLACSSHESIQRLLQSISTCFPRLQGHGWNIQKFHDHLHLVHGFMSRFGSAMNFDAGNGEHSLIKFAKRVYEKVQKRGQKVVMEQSAILHTKYACMRKGRRGLRMIADPVVAPKERYTGLVGNPQYEVVVGDDGGVVFNWLTKKNTLSNRDIHPVVLHWFANTGITDPSVGKGTFTCYTEYKRDGQRFRAHPSYNSRGPWHDWVLVFFEEETDISRATAPAARGGEKPKEPRNKKDRYPSKILCFFVNKLGDIQALVHTTTKFDPDQSSCLCEIWQQEYEAKPMFDKGIRTRDLQLVPTIHNVPTESFEGRLLVFEELPGVRESVLPDRFSDRIPRVTLVHPQAVWASEFTNMSADPEE